MKRFAPRYPVQDAMAALKFLSLLSGAQTARRLPDGYTLKRIFEESGATFASCAQNDRLDDPALRLVPGRPDELPTQARGRARRLADVVALPGGGDLLVKASADIGNMLCRLGEGVQSMDVAFDGQKMHEAVVVLACGRANERYEDGRIVGDALRPEQAIAAIHRLAFHYDCEELQMPSSSLRALYAAGARMQNLSLTFDRRGVKAMGVRFRPRDDAAARRMREALDEVGRDWDGAGLFDRVTVDGRARIGALDFERGADRMSARFTVDLSRIPDQPSAAAMSGDLLATQGCPDAGILGQRFLAAAQAAGARLRSIAFATTGVGAPALLRFQPAVPA